MFSRKIFHATSYVTLTQSLIALGATFALAGEMDPFWGTMGGRWRMVYLCHHFGFFNFRLDGQHDQRNAVQSFLSK